MNRLSVDEFHAAGKLPIVVVLDNVRSQHNIGAVFRTADAFLLQGIYLCGICCCPPNQEIHKTALGAEQTVDWRYAKDTIEAVQTLQKEGYTVYSVEQAKGSIRIEDVEQQLLTNDGKLRPIAIVMGHEVFGVQQHVVDASNGCIELPQYGTKHSLNVSVAAGIVMYQLATAMRRIKQ